MLQHPKPQRRTNYAYRKRIEHYKRGLFLGNYKGVGNNCQCHRIGSKSLATPYCVVVLRNDFVARKGSYTAHKLCARSDGCISNLLYKLHRENCSINFKQLWQVEFCSLFVGVSECGAVRGAYLILKQSLNEIPQFFCFHFLATVKNRFKAI
jgi:hypothetical protein